MYSDVTKTKRSGVRDDQAVAASSVILTAVRLPVTRFDAGPDGATFLGYFLLGTDESPAIEPG